MASADETRIGTAVELGGLGALGPDDQPAITGPSGTLDYAELRGAVRDLAKRLQPGERIAVDDEDTAKVLIAVLAAAEARAAAIVIDPAWPARAKTEALRLTKAGTIVPNDPTWWMGFTSGSAGTPRPIARTARSWVGSFPLVSEVAGLAVERSAGRFGSLRVLIGGSLASSLFLFGALHALWMGAHVLVPGRWAPENLPPADVAHCVPAMLADLVARPDPPPLVICAGAAIGHQVRDRAVTRGIRVLEYYGATELSFVAWRDRDGRLLPFPGVEVRLRDGEIWARSPFLALGYADPEHSAEGSALRFDADGYATVGDLGVIGADGGLTILGRGDGTILTGGAPVLPQDVENVLLTVAGVKDAVVVGTPHPRLGSVVTAVIEPDVSGVPGLAELRAVARAALANQQIPRRWYLVSRIPRSGSGKPARREIQAAASQGTLPARRRW